MSEEELVAAIAKLIGVKPDHVHATCTYGHTAIRWEPS